MPQRSSRRRDPPTRLRNQRRYRSRSPAVTVFAGFAWGSGVYSLTALVAILAAIVVVLGPLIIWWMRKATVRTVRMTRRRADLDSGVAAGGSLLHEGFWVIPERLARDGPGHGTRVQAVADPPHRQEKGWP